MVNYPALRFTVGAATIPNVAVPYSQDFYSLQIPHVCLKIKWVGNYLGFKLNTNGSNDNDNDTGINNRDNLDNNNVQ